jgi:hypothetical protein
MLQKPKQNQWFLVGMFIIVIFILFILIRFLYNSPPGEAERLRQEITTKLPLGSSRVKVESWLKEHGFHPTLVIGNKGMQGLSVCISKESAWYGCGVINIRFSFDEKMELSARDIDWIAYSP